MAILFDSGPIIAAVGVRDQRHHEANDFFAGLRLAQDELLLPSTVTAEVGYMLNADGGPSIEADFLAGVADGDFTPIDLLPEDYARMAELVTQYADLPLGTTDASVIAIAERLSIAEIATFDHRHFRVVRPRHTESFTLLP